jgi:hypothetical protein
VTGNRLWIIVGSVLIVAILAIGYLLVISPKLAEADATAALVQSALAQQNSTQADLVRLKGQYNNLGELTAKLTALKILVPETQEGSTFADELASFEKSSGAVITKLDLAEGTPVTAPVSTAPISTAAPSTASTPAPATTAPPVVVTAGAAAVGSVWAVKITITLTGDPAQIAAFSKLAQNGSRFFLDTQFNFTTPKASGGSSGGSGGASSGKAGTSNSGTLGGYLYVVAGGPGLPTDTPTPVAVPTVTPTVTPTTTPPPTPSSTPTP